MPSELILCERLQWRSLSFPHSGVTHKSTSSFMKVWDKGYFCCKYHSYFKMNKTGLLNNHVIKKSASYIQIKATKDSTYLLLIECEVRTVSYGPEFFFPFLWPKREARVPWGKKQGSVTYGTDRAKEVNKMFIIWIFFLLFWSGADFELLLIFTFRRPILKRARKFPRFSLTHVVSVGFQISQSEWMFERNFQLVLLLVSLIGFSVSYNYLTVLRDVSASGNQKRTFV